MSRDGTTESRTAGVVSPRKITTDGTAPKTRALRALGEFRRRAAGPQREGRREGGKRDRAPRKKEGRSEPETRAPREPARSRNPHVYALGIIGTRREAEVFGCLLFRLFPEGGRLRGGCAKVARLSAGSTLERGRTERICFHCYKSPEQEAKSQQIVGQSLLSCLQYPVPYISRLQRIYPSQHSKLRWSMMLGRSLS